jgi:hypothetical protein
MPSLLMCEPPTQTATLAPRYGISPKRLLLDVLSALEPEFYKAQVHYEFTKNFIPATAPVSLGSEQAVKASLQNVLALCGPGTMLHLECFEIQNRLGIRINPWPTPFIKGTGLQGPWTIVIQSADCTPAPRREWQ